MTSHAAAAKPPVAGLSFDATGTLFSCPRLGDIYSEVLARHGVEIAPPAVLDAFRQAWLEFDCRETPQKDRWQHHSGGARGWWSEVIARVCTLAGAAQPSSFAVAELFHRFTRADAWEVYPDVRPVLEELQSRSIPMVVTSNWDERLPSLLENLGLRGFFERVVISQDVGVAKPAPEIFAEARDALAAVSDPAARFAHVGDSRLADAEGAQAAHFVPVLLDRAEDGRGDITSLCELSAFLGL